jgi:hypothetical protein
MVTSSSTAFDAADDFCPLAALIASTGAMAQINWIGHDKNRTAGT